MCNNIFVLTKEPFFNLHELLRIVLCAFRSTTPFLVEGATMGVASDHGHSDICAHGLRSEFASITRPDSTRAGSLV